ncbi:(4Fe-4S)-binding protein [Ascidiimonas aurantiaca]|uniref:(4Fe-4S)-binding protein n=1 Tax=Ascidiimonas aurantiaca TaxID=1685432 RepID=UPI0030EB31CB
MDTKEYTNGNITIVWKPSLCEHSGNCVKGSPKVFKPGEKPWINAQAENSEAIVKTINTCPSGALSYYRTS